MTNITFELELQISAFYRKPVKTFSLNMVDAKQRMGSRNGDSDDSSEISRTSAAATRFEDQAIRLVLWDGKGKLRTSVYLDDLEKKQTILPKVILTLFYLFLIFWTKK